MGAPPDRDSNSGERAGTMSTSTTRGKRRGRAAAVAAMIAMRDEREASGARSRGKKRKRKSADVERGDDEGTGKNDAATTATNKRRRRSRSGGGNGKLAPSTSPKPQPPVGRAGTGRRNRQRFDPNSWSRSIPPRRTNVFCLGVSYPCVTTQLRIEDVSSTVIDMLHHPQPSVEQAVELVRRNLLTQMDGRDLARCLAVEHYRNDTLAYTASLENGAIYTPRHLTANFNRPNFARDCKRRFGKTIKFRQIILDYFWIPGGSWSMTHWTNAFFQTTLPSFVKEGLLDTDSIYSSLTLSVGPDDDEAKPAKRAVVGDGEAAGVVYLPFCLHCVLKVIAFYKELSECYTISFMHKSELAEHALWHATSTIDPDVMQNWLGKAINQEDIYCTIQPSEVQWAAHDSHVRKEDVLHIMRGIDDFEDIRMIRLQALRPKKHMYEGKEGTRALDHGEMEKGGFVGLKPPNEVRFGFDHLLQVQKEAAEEKKRQVIQKKVQEKVLRKRKATHRRRQQQKPEPLRKQQDGSDGETDDEEEEVNWVQCDKCKKWRVVPDWDASDKVSSRWFCEMNSDPQRNSCDATEQTEKEVEEDESGAAAEEEKDAAANPPDVDISKPKPSQNQKYWVEDGGKAMSSGEDSGCCQNIGQSAVISHSALPAAAPKDAKAVMATATREITGEFAHGSNIVICSRSSGKGTSCQRQEEAFTTDEEASSSSLVGKGGKHCDAGDSSVLVKAVRYFFTDSELLAHLSSTPLHRLTPDAVLLMKKISPSSTPSALSDSEQSKDESHRELIEALGI